MAKLYERENESENESENEITEKVRLPISTIDTIANNDIKDHIAKYSFLAGLFRALREHEDTKDILNRDQISNDMRTKLAAPLRDLVNALNDRFIGARASEEIQKQGDSYDTLLLTHTQLNYGMIGLTERVAWFPLNEEQKNQFVAGWLGAVRNNKIGTFYEDNSTSGDHQNQLQGSVAMLRGLLESESSKNIATFAIIEQEKIYSNKAAGQGATR